LIVQAGLPFAEIRGSFHRFSRRRGRKKKPVHPMVWRRLILPGTPAALDPETGMRPDSRAMPVGSVPFPHLGKDDSAAGGWVGCRVLLTAGFTVLVLAMTGCVVHTSYPADWPALEPPAGQSPRSVAGRYQNAGMHIDDQGARRTIRLTELLSCVTPATESSPPPSQFLAESSGFLRPMRAPDTVILELSPSRTAAHTFPMNVFADAEAQMERVDARMEKLGPVVKSVRARSADGTILFQNDAAVLPSQSVLFALSSSQGHRLTLKLRKAKDGSLVGRIDHLQSAPWTRGNPYLPFFYWRDAWVRFAPVPGSQ